MFSILQAEDAKIQAERGYEECTETARREVISNQLL